MNVYIEVLNEEASGTFESNLQHLELSNWLYENAKHQINFIKSLKNLKSLRILGNEEKSGIKFSDILDGKDLEAIEANFYCDLFNEEWNVNAILTQTNLKELKIPKFLLGDVLFMKIIETLPNLETFAACLDYCDSRKFHHLEKLKNLQNLELHSENHYQIVEISRLKLENLKKLKVRNHNFEIEPEIIENMKKNFSNLSYIGYLSVYMVEEVGFNDFTVRSVEIYIKESAKQKHLNQFRFRTFDFTEKMIEKLRDKNIEKFITFEMVSYDNNLIFQFFNFFFIIRQLTINHFYEGNKFDIFINTERIIRSMNFDNCRQYLARCKQILEKFGDKLQTLYFNCKLNSSELVSLLNSVPNVENLTFHNDFDEATESGEKSVVNLSHLKSIKLGGSFNRTFSVQALKLIKLGSGKLTEFSLLSDDKDSLIIANEFLRCQQNLKYLRFNACNKTFEMPENFLTNCNLKGLDWMNTNKVEDTKKFFDFLKSQKHLKTLRIRMTTNIDDNFDDILSSMSELEELEISSLKNLTDRGFKQISKLPKLKELTFNFYEMKENEIHSFFEILEDKVIPTIERVFLKKECEYQYFFNPTNKSCQVKELVYFI